MPVIVAMVRIKFDTQACHFVYQRFFFLQLFFFLRSPPVLSGVCFSPSLAVYVCFLDRCLSFDLRILITPLVASNFSRMTFSHEQYYVRYIFIIFTIKLEVKMKRESLVETKQVRLLLRIRCV